MSNTPSDEEIAACIASANVRCVHPDAETTIDIARAVLAKWGTPQPAPAPLSEQAEEAAMYRWLRAQHEDDSDGPRCCVYAPNDMRECLVPVGDMPGELDAFIRAALAAQGGK